MPSKKTPQRTRSDARSQIYQISLAQISSRPWNLSMCVMISAYLMQHGIRLTTLLLPKLVKFKSESNQPESLCCSVFLRGQLRSQCTVSSPEETQSVLDSTHALVLCGGCGMKSEKQGRYISFAGCYFSIKCTYVCESKGPCIHCKYLRKLLQNQLSRKWQNGGISKRLQKHANTRRSLRTAQKKLLNAEWDLAAMRQANQQIADEVLSARIKSLPEKQQMAVRACFQAATRKSTSGTLYGVVVHLLLFGVTDT
ncbi:uncharacterized protein [Dermacentor albipictus]|uniref:uncharacterized protein n=1 Tax=Dermacentor albipictus TaxID=60249 RepID=UPI0038FBEE5E